MYIDPVTYSITYPVVDITKQLITRCSVSVRTNNVVDVKVAKSTTPESLSTLELNSFQSYLNTIMPAGIQTNAISLNPDQIRIEADIYYNGQYSSVIQTNVELAVNNYLSARPFGGTFVVSEMETSILSVAGVKDINIKSITARLDSDIFSLITNTKIYIQQGTTSDINNRKYVAYAGYLIPETTTLNTLSDTLKYYIQ